jgi:hypothetical protein
MMNGRLLAESLRLGADLDLADVRLTRLGRHDVSPSVADSQPKIWTFVDFEVPEERADALAAALAGALLPDDGWYADFQSPQEHVVVFADRIFRYRKGDLAARARAVDYGRAAGTPEHQLDWGD